LAEAVTHKQTANSNAGITLNITNSLLSKVTDPERIDYQVVISVAKGE
jgi:hypothetical protein